MSQVTLGKTGITVNKNGFGALPIQRVEKGEAVRLLKMAFDGGITFYDSSRFYTDSEEKLGEAFMDVRERLHLATKTMARTVQNFWDDLHTSLKYLKTDYIDVFQFHNPPFCPLPGDESGLYDAMLEAKKQGKIRWIGLTNHRLGVARDAVLSGFYDTLQFPFSYLSTDRELEIVELCKDREVGFIAMKALSGGLIKNSAAAYAYFREFEHVLPIWGVQKEAELMEFLSYVKDPPAMTPELLSVIESDKRDLPGDFCRGCGYCLPCPAGIEIYSCARMSLMIRRAVYKAQITPSAQAMMKKIEDCQSCGACKKRCPYGLDTPKLLKENYADYQEILAGKQI